jgi:hypothetical protein
MRKIISGVLVLLIVFLPASASALTSAQWQTLYGSTEYYTGSGGGQTGSTGSTGSSGGNGCSNSTFSLASGSSVYILGDSITERAEAQYQASFQQLGITANIDASSSRSLSSPGKDGNLLTGMQAISQDTTQIKQAGAIVIALGTNGGDTNQSIDQAISAIQSDNSTAPIYWIDLISVGRTNGYNQSTIGPGNQAIYSQGQIQNYTVISWFKTVDPNGNPQNPNGAEVDPNNYIDNSDNLGVHPTPAGINALVGLVSNTVTGKSTADTTPGSCSSTTTPPGSGGGGTTTLSGSDDVTQIYNYLTAKSQGLTPMQAAGIIGNMFAESDFQPETLENKGGCLTPAGSVTPGELSNGQLGWGLIQWTPPSKIIDSTALDGDPDDLATQLNFLWNDYMSAQEIAQLKTQPTPQSAASDFESTVELDGSCVLTNGVYVCGDTIRGDYAEAYYQYLANGVPLPANDNFQTVFTLCTS